MAKEKSDSPELGHKFGKPDLERIGLFSEMAYLTGKYYPAKKKVEREARNLYCEGRKTKNGTQHGYFEPVFKRIFSKEALKGRGKKQPPQKFKNVSERPFLPSSGFKQHSSPGDHYGTFSGIIPAFSDKRKRKEPHKPENRNLFSNPGKLGGPGYADICLNPYPKHQTDRYGVKPKYKQYGNILAGPMVTAHCPQPYFDENPFADAKQSKPGPTYVPPKAKERPFRPPGVLVPTGPGKLQGGCHDGCFNKFPTHVPEKYKPKMKKVQEGIFQPPTTLKSYYNTSILHQNVDIKINTKNYLNFAPQYTKYILMAN